MKPSDCPRNPGAKDDGRNAHLAGRVAAALMSDEVLARHSTANVEQTRIDYRQRPLAGMTKMTIT
jgi:hypothetical protein